VEDSNELEINDLKKKSVYLPPFDFEAASPKKPTTINLIEINIIPSSEAEGTNVSEDIPKKPDKPDSHRWARWWDRSDNPQAPWNAPYGPYSVADEPMLQVMLLSMLYDVRPEILKTDKEYYSDETLLRTIKDKVYFISAESPIETCKITELLIREASLRVQTMHANRVQKATITKQTLAEKIAQIQEAYKARHEGEEPSMNKLAHLLNDHKIESPRGKGSKWYGETVKRVLAKPADESIPDQGQSR